MTRQTSHALAVLARLARRRPAEREKLVRALTGRLDVLLETALSVAIETGGPIGEVIADVFRDSSDPTLFERVRATVPLDTITLRSLATQVHEKGWIPAPAAAQDEQDEDVWLDHIGRLNMLSYAQRRAGLRSASTATAREGVDLARRLERQQPGRFGAALASTLTMLAASLPMNAANAPEAVRLSQEAVDLTRDLATEQPDPFESHLADNLNDLAWYLRARGDLVAAVAAASEAVERLDRLSARGGESGRNLAAALYTLGSLQIEAGDPAAALAPTERAARLREDRAHHHPDAELVDLLDCRILHAEALLANQQADKAAAVGQLVADELRWLLDLVTDPIPEDVLSTIREGSRLLDHLRGRQ